MRFLYFFLLFTIALASCSKLDTVEVKEMSTAKVLERFFVDKKTKLKQGKYQSFHLNGQLHEASNYVDGQLHGEQKFYYESGKLESVAHHKNGQFEGVYQKFSEDGKLMNEGQYLDNVASGIWKRWYGNGQLMEEVTLADNNENGPFKEYYQNGTLKAEGTYLNGENEQGELKIYNENGELEKRMYCEYGNCTESWNKQSGDLPVDTLRLLKLAELKKKLEAGEQGVEIEANDVQ